MPLNHKHASFWSKLGLFMPTEELAKPTEAELTHLEYEIKILELYLSRRGFDITAFSFSGGKSGTQRNPGQLAIDIQCLAKTNFEQTNQALKEHLIDLGYQIIEEKEYLTQVLLPEVAP